MYQIDGTHTEAYLLSSRTIWLKRDGAFIGTAERTGVTAPGYIDRPCYRIDMKPADREACGLPDNPQEIFVLDGGRFHPSHTWHQDAANLAPPKPVFTLKGKSHANRTRRKK